MRGTMGPRDVISTLAEAGIAVLVTGSTAMNYYAEPRGTGDMDLLLDLDPATFDERVRPLFEPRWYVAAAIATGDDFLAQLSSGTVRFDLIMRPDPWTDARFARGVPVDDPVLGEVALTSPEDLVLAKLESCRAVAYELHWADARNISRNNDLDWSYIDAWAARLRVTDLVSRLRHET
jgi:hypothetical protein